MSGLRAVPARIVFAVLLVVALGVAGAVSLVASQSPDGLNRVATDEGFADTATDSAAADGPLAGYRTEGVQDPGLSRAAAGITGSLVVLALTGGITYAVRRRSATDPAPQVATDVEGG